MSQKSLDERATDSSLRQSSALGRTGMREAAQSSHLSAADGLERAGFEMNISRPGGA